MTSGPEAPPNAPSDHPPVAFGRTGVLISNLGTPDSYSYWPMRRYLSQFLSDKRVIDYPRWRWQPVLQLIVLTKRPFSSGKAYRDIWNSAAGESPLLTITKRQAAKLRDLLRRSYGDRILVGFGMRYGNPSIESALRALLDKGCRQILHFPLYPQYSAATTATANDAVFRVLMEMEVKWQPALRTVAPYFDHPAYIAALAESVRSSLAGLDFAPDTVVATYHGLPQRYLTEGDPYHCQCRKTSRLLTEHLGWPGDRLVTAFQSRFGPEEWLRPYTIEEVANLARAGRRNIAVIAPGFSADCIETLDEILREIKDSFLKAGGKRFFYIPCLNADDAHMAMIAGIIDENLGGWIK